MYLVRRLRELTHQPIDQIVNARYEKFRRMGVFLESATTSPPAPGPIASANGQNGLRAANGGNVAGTLRVPSA